MLSGHGYSTVTEVTLPNGRRADILGVDAKGRLVIVEVKSGLADFIADSKWPEYAPFCDCFYFAVDPSFPHDRLPDGVGLIVADGFDGAILRAAPETPLAAARRRKMLIDIARHAATRLHRAEDPAKAAG